MNFKIDIAENEENKNLLSKWTENAAKELQEKIDKVFMDELILRVIKEKLKNNEDLTEEELVIIAEQI